MPMVEPAARQPAPSAAPRCRRQPGRRRLTAAGAGLVDPSAPGKRLVVAPQKLDPSMLEDVRKAEAFGPRGALLIGMDADDCAAVQRWFDAMEPGLVASCCPAALLADGTLGQAVREGAALPRRPWERQPAGAPPLVFLSGMSGGEQVALIEAWAEHTGLQAPAFAAVTPGTLGKQLSKLVTDIVRAQAQAPPPGFDPEQAQQLQAAAQQAAAAGEAAPAAGGEAALRGKLQDYVMLNERGQGETAPMSLDQLKEQIQEKMRRKKAEQAAAERQARKAASRDQTDAVREALRGGKKGKQGKGKQQAAGGGRGFGSK